VRVSAGTLALSAALLLAAAALFGGVGAQVRRRRVEAVDPAALRAFALWWVGAALVLVLLAVRLGLGAMGVIDPAPLAGLGYLTSVPLGAAVGGLLYYLLYLLTGKRLGVPVGALYAAFVLFAWAYTTSQAPWHVEVGAWDARLVGAGSPDRRLLAVYGALLAVPPVLAAIAYAGLAWRLPRGPARARAAVLALALLQLFAALLASFLLGVASAPWFALVYESSALVAGLLAMLAYRPPAWARARLGLAPIETA
jgi:hypothetical protein